MHSAASETTTEIMWTAFFYSLRRRAANESGASSPKDGGVLVEGYGPTGVENRRGC